MTAKQILKRVLGVLYVGTLLWLSYAIYWVHEDTMKTLVLRNKFIEECIASGNHLEERGQRETYVYGCFEGPPSKLVKKFQ